MKIIDQIVALGNQEAHTEGWLDRKDGKFKYSKVNRALTSEDIAAHLNGGKARGMYLTTNGKSHCLVLDFDDHGKRALRSDRLWPSPPCWMNTVSRT